MGRTLEILTCLPSPLSCFSNSLWRVEEPWSSLLLMTQYTLKSYLGFKMACQPSKPGRDVLKEAVVQLTMWMTVYYIHGSPIHPFFENIAGGPWGGLGMSSEPPPLMQVGNHQQGDCSLKSPLRVLLGIPGIFRQNVVSVDAWEPRSQLNMGHVLVCRARLHPCCLPQWTKGSWLPIPRT